MSLQVTGTWFGGVWAEDTWADCVWYEPGCEAAAPAADPVLEDTGGGSGGSWPSPYEQNKKRRKLIEEDDQLIMDMIAQSLAEIMKYDD